MANKDAKEKKAAQGDTELVSKLLSALTYDEGAEGIVQLKLDAKVVEESLPDGMDMKQVKSVQKAEQRFTVALEAAVGEKACELREANDKVTGAQATVKLGHNRATARFVGKEDVEGGEPTYGASYLTYRTQASADTGDIADIRKRLSEKAKAVFG